MKRRRRTKQIKPENLNSSESEELEVKVKNQSKRNIGGLWSTVELLQSIIRIKFNLDDFYNTESVQSEAVLSVFNKMNDHYHKILFPKGTKYPCGVTNRMTTLQKFPISSTSSNKKYFEKRINSYLDNNLEEIEKI